MSESNLGTAVLSLRVDTGSALQALTQFRQQAERELQNTGEINFNGVTRQARQSGQQAGRALAEGIRQATQGVRFDSITEALDFSAALNGTLRDLRQYRDALVALRDVTNATAPGFYELNDAIEATTQAIRNYSSGTDALQDQAARIATRELSQELRRQRDAVLENARVDRQWGDALRTIEGAQRSAAAATREANQAFRDQVSAVGSLAQKGAKDVGGTIGAIGRGVGAAARGAINLGKAGYSLGAEFGVFEEPRTGPVKKAIQDVVDRFKFLGEQAETTRGIILRSFEGAGAAAGLAAIAQNADQLKAALNGLSTAAKTTDAAVGGIAKLGQYLADVFNNGGWLTDNGKTIIGQLLNISAATEKAAASSVSLGDQLIQLGAGAAGGALNGLEAVINVIGSIPPEAQAAVLALAGISVGFKEEPIIEGLTRVLEYLDGLKSKSLQVRGDLQNVLNGLEQFQQKLNSGNNQKLLPAFTERGLQVLDDTVREGQSFQRISDAIGSSWERGARYLEKSNEEMRRLIEQGLELKQLGTGPSGIVPQQTNQLPPGAPASIRPNPNQYATPGATAPALPRQLLEDDLAAVQARRLAIEEERAEVAAKALALDQKEFAIRRFRFGGPTSVGIDGRLPDGSFAPGSPGDIASQRKEEKRRLDARRKSFKEAGANALIGGAFPALFGQGLGASVGGAFGGGAGGLVGGQFGFGLSLIGTAAGAQFDEAINKLKALGDALSDPINQFGALSEAGLISSKGLEKQIQALIDTGREADAAALIQTDLAKSYGDLSSAKELAKSSDELGRSWAQLQVAVADLVATPLASVLEDVGKSVENFAILLRDLKESIPKPVKDAGLNLLKFGYNATIGSGAAITQGIARFAVNNEPSIQARRRANGELDANVSETLQRSEARLTDLRQLRLRLITQEAQQQEVAANQTERQTVELEKQIALENSRAKGERPEQQQKIADDFNKRLLQIDERRLQLEKDRTKEVQNRFDIERRAELQFRQIQRQFATDRKAAANNFADIQGGIEIQRKRSALGLSGTGVGALQDVESIQAAKRGAELAAVQRKAAEGRAIDLEREAQILRRRQEALEDPNSGATRAQINEAVDAALQARNSAQEAKNQYVLAGDALKAAGAEIIRAAETAKGNLQDAFRSAKDAFQSAQDSIRNIKRGIEDSVLAISELRNTSGSGLNKFLSPQQVKDRQAAEASILRPQAEALANQLGIRFQTTGTREQINKQLQDFIRSARQELRMSEDLNQVQQIDLPKATDNLFRATNDLSVVNESLLKVNTELASVTDALAQKDWAVNVSVNANTGDYAVNLG